MASIILNSISETEKLGKWLAANLGEYGFPLLILRGDLGSGKTTLARYIVENLPAFEKVEFSSPSFTIINNYPTIPETAHCDLYRCHTTLPDELLEYIEEGGQQIIVEWGDFFPKSLRPFEYLDICFKMDKNNRSLEIVSSGTQCSLLLQKLTATYPD